MSLAAPYQAGGLGPTDTTTSSNHARVGWRQSVRNAAAREGAPLDPSAHGALGAADGHSGHDFSRVRVHADDAAEQAADQLSARAFTVGPHLFFGRGQYRPHDATGRETLRHELAHVAQDPETDPADVGSLPLSTAADLAEREADAAQSGGGLTTPQAPGVRRILSAYTSSHSEIIPSMAESSSASSVTSTGDAGRLSTALAALIGAGKIVTETRGDMTYFVPPATGAATLAEVTTALRTAGFAKATEMASRLLDGHNAWVFAGEEVYQTTALFWTFDVGRQRDTLHTTDRPLTADERSEASIVFGPGLDYSAITIREDPVLGSGNIARTLPGSINFPPGASGSSGFMPWLIHELTHSWQYQHGVGLARTATTALLCYFDIQSYRYGGEPGLAAATAAGHRLRSFNTEQQGDIARDYYRAVKAGRPTAAFAPFVAELQAP
jgi:hypothetical protein